MRTMRIEKPPDCRIMLSCLSMDELSPIVWPSCVKTSMHLLKDLYYIITLHYLYYVKGGVLYSLGLYLPITYYCTFLFHCWKVQVILLYKDSFLTTKWGGGESYPQEPSRSLSTDNSWAKLSLPPPMQHDTYFYHLKRWYLFSSLWYEHAFKMSFRLTRQDSRKNQSKNDWWWLVTVTKYE